MAKTKPDVPQCCPICLSKTLNLFSINDDDDVSKYLFSPGEQVGITFSNELYEPSDWQFVAITYICDNEHKFWINTNIY